MWYYIICWSLLKHLFKTLTYSPLLLSSYSIAYGILKKEDTAILWIGLIMICSIILYLLLYFLKGMLIGLKSYGNWLWVPIFITCTLFTSVLPVWIVFDDITATLAVFSKPADEKLALIASIAVGFCFYSRFHFLTNMAPQFAFPFFQMGIDLAIGFLKISARLKWIKSKQSSNF